MHCSVQKLCRMTLDIYKIGFPSPGAHRVAGDMRHKHKKIIKNVFNYY